MKKMIIAILSIAVLASPALFAKGEGKNKSTIQLTKQLKTQIKTLTQTKKGDKSQTSQKAVAAGKGKKKGLYK